MGEIALQMQRCMVVLYTGTISTTLKETKYRAFKTAMKNLNPELFHG